MRRSNNKSMSMKFWAIMINSAFPLLYFLIFTFRIDAKLFHQAQQPVFFFHRAFISFFTSYAGGLDELSAAFLMQFFYRTWSGAALLTILFTCIALAGYLLIRRLNNRSPVLFLHWLPTIFLFILLHDYDFPLAVATGFLFAILAAGFFLSRGYKNAVVRGGIFFALYAVLYYIAGGPALLFITVALLYDFIYQRIVILPVFYLVLGAVIPFLCSEFLFIQTPGTVYLMNLGLIGSSQVTWTAFLLLYFPALVLLFGLVSRVRINNKRPGKWWRAFFAERKTWTIAVQLGVIFLLIGAASLYFMQKKQKALLSLDFAAEHHVWKQVIKTVQDGRLLDAYIGRYQLNRALYHTGQLCETMFAFPQVAGLPGLFMPENIRHLFPIQYSDLFYDLGLINESQHWAHEALSVTGDTPRNLQRLALVYVLKKEYAAAHKCLALLNRTLRHKRWANQLSDAIETKDFSSYPGLKQLEALTLTSDFIVIPNQPEACLEELLTTNSSNKMAFEYYMMGLLLDGKVGRFINRLHGLEHIDYQKTPRHFEEAILLYMMNTGRRDFTPPPAGLSANTMAAFQDYVGILKKYPNPTAAYRELAAKYGNTYWFYASYVYKKDQ